MDNSSFVKGMKDLVGEFRSLALREFDFYKKTPRVATMFLTYRCDSKCKTCNMWQRDQTEEIGKEIDFDTWKVIIDKLVEAGIKIAEPFGGNALLRKELLVSVLKYLYQKGISIHLPTNQIGLDDEVAEAIVRYVDTVYLSNDGLGNEQDLVRGVEGASRLAEDAIEKILRLRKKIHDRPNQLRIVCNCTVSKYNISSIENVASYALTKGFDEIDFEYAGEFEKEAVESSKILGITPYAQYMRQGDSILANKEEAAIIKESLVNIKRRYKDSSIYVQTINIDSLSLKNLYEGTIPHKKCYIERTEVTIDPYGNIVICPFITNYVLGNLASQSFDCIWDNQKQRIFREAQNSGRLPMCRSCILGVQRNPSFMKSLHRIYLLRIKPKSSRFGEKTSER